MNNRTETPVISFRIVNGILISCYQSIITDVEFFLWVPDSGNFFLMIIMN